QTSLLDHTEGAPSLDGERFFLPAAIVHADNGQISVALGRVRFECLFLHLGRKVELCADVFHVGSGSIDVVGDRVLQNDDYDTEENEDTNHDDHPTGVEQFNHPRSSVHGSIHAATLGQSEWKQTQVGQVIE